MKKAIVTAAAFFLSFAVLSCSDVFGGSETQGVAFTIPSLVPSNGTAGARAVGGASGGPWSIHAFLFGEDADPDQIKNFTNGQYVPPSADEAQNYKGLIQTVSRRGADLTRPQPLFFQRIKAKTKCFICVLVTYTSSDKTEHTVFYGISPHDVVQWGAVRNLFTGNFYTPDTGENDISVTLKKNESAPVYFATQNGVGTIDSYGNSTYSPQESTPYKPTHFYGYNTGAAMETGALYAGKALRRNSVIILMDDIDVSDIASPLSISTSDNGVGHSADFASISGKRCKLKAQGFSVSEGRYLSFRDILIAADSNSVSINEEGELKLGGAVSLDAGMKIDLAILSPSQSIGNITITNPLTGKVGEVSVTFRDPTSVDDMEDYVEKQPLVRDDTGSADVPACFGSVVTVTCLVPPTPHAQASFTARWKRIGNSWALEARD